MDYKINLGINIIPVIVIDYSLSNLTFQEDNECIHTLKEGADNAYIIALENITKSFKNLSSQMMGFGIGGLTYPKQKSASNIFSLSGDVFDPLFENHELVNNYKDVLGKIRISSPANLCKQ